MSIFSRHAAKLVEGIAGSHEITLDCPCPGLPFTRPHDLDEMSWLAVEFDNLFFTDEFLNDCRDLAEANFSSLS